MRAMTMLEGLDASGLRQMAGRWRTQADPLSVANIGRGAGGFGHTGVR